MPEAGGTRAFHCIDQRKLTTRGRGGYEGPPQALQPRLLSAIPAEMFARHPNARVFTVKIVQALDVGANANPHFARRYGREFVFALLVASMTMKK